VQTLFTVLNKDFIKFNPVTLVGSGKEAATNLLDAN